MKTQNAQKGEIVGVAIALACIGLHNLLKGNRTPKQSPPPSYPPSGGHLGGSPNALAMMLTQHMRNMTNITTRPW